MPAEICAASGSIKTMCISTISFTLIFVIFAAIVTMVVFSKKLTNNYALVISSLIRIAVCFFIADTALKQIAEPERYGIEWFTLSYYLWCFILFNIFLTLILLPSKTKFLLSATTIITIISIPVFAYTGRGHFEQITPLAGGLFGKISFDMLWLSFSFRLFLGLAAIAIISGFVSLMAYWVINGKFSFSGLKRNLILCSFFLLLLILPVTSIPLGEIYNNKDVADAKHYIDEVKLKVDRYYYENGEYPKFIDKMLPEKSSPKLLQRHEFFTYGIRGTYYFSRNDKYCFLFQNPAREFGYYSLTSERGWRLNKTGASYDDVFVNLCDESNKNFEDLISGHLGANPDDKLINDISIEAGAAVVPATSNTASQILEDKIIEGAKKDPSLLKYFESPPEK